MENGTIDVAQLIQHVTKYSSLSYRFVAYAQDDGTWLVTRLILGAPPASWQQYDYPRQRFFAGEIAGTVIGDWLEEGAIELAHQQYKLLQLQTSATFERRPSHTTYYFFTLQKPYTFYSINSANMPSSCEGLLASDDAPFFLSLQEAERCLLYDRNVNNPLLYQDQLPPYGVVLYLEQDEGWLEHVHFSSSVLAITLEGTNLSDVKLKVIGTGVEAYDDYPSGKTVTLSAPDGPPESIRIALLKGNNWLDYFYDDQSRRYNPFAPKRTNVVFDYQELGEEITRLIESGEGRTIEFKSEESEKQSKWTKTFVAFANTDGGYILFGVDDEGNVVGLQKEIRKHGSLGKLRDSLTNTIANTVTPIPPFEFLPPVRIGEHDVLALKVMSDVHPHSLYIDKTHVFFIRRDATTRAANNLEVQELVRLKDEKKGVKEPGVVRGL